MACAASPANVARPPWLFQLETPSSGRGGGQSSSVSTLASASPGICVTMDRNGSAQSDATLFMNAIRSLLVPGMLIGVG